MYIAAPCALLFFLVWDAEKHLQTHSCWNLLSSVLSEKARRKKTAALVSFGAHLSGLSSAKDRNIPCWGEEEKGGRFSLWVLRLYIWVTGV